MTREKAIQERIVSQVEFYLGDANMPRDKFLREQSAKDADGWISIDVIASFQRMKAITGDAGAIKAALEEADSAVFEVDEGGANVRRKDPLPETCDTMPRSIYVKGFPKTATLDELLAFFHSTAGSVEAVRMRRFPSSKEFKGSVFVEFASEADAKKYLQHAPGKSYNGSDLIAMSKLAYFESKNDPISAELDKLAEDYSKGCLVKLTDLSSANTSYTIIKSALSEVAPCEISFVEQQQDGTTYVRLKEAMAQELVSLISSREDFKINGMAVAASVPSDEEEAQYYRNLAAIMVSKRASGKYDSKKKRTQDGGFRNGNNKKRDAEESEGSTSKAIKKESEEE